MGTRMALALEISCSNANLGEERRHRAPSPRHLPAMREPPSRYAGRRVILAPVQAAAAKAASPAPATILLVALICGNDTLPEELYC